MNKFLHSINLDSLGYASLMFVGFVAVMFLGTIFLPGKVYPRYLQPDKTHQSYKLNGLLLFTATTLGVVILTLLFHFSLAPLYTYFWSLFIVANVFAFVVTAILYIKGRRIHSGNIQAQPLGKIFSDLWFGIELNPTWADVDLKMFAYQPSLIGLGLLNASFAYVQYEKYGEITLQMLIFQVFWWLYLATHY